MDISSGGENEGKIGRVKKMKKGFKIVEFDNFELVFVYYQLVNYMVQKE